MYLRSLARLLRENSYSVLLLGPRQTGKSTLLRSLEPELAIDLASEKTFFEFSADPGRLEGLLQANRAKSVLIDEIQRLPSLLNTVQSLIDAHKGRTRFLMSGSSARKLRRGSANLLPGRAITYQLGPLTLDELAGDRSIRDLLSYGNLPGIVSEPKAALKRALLSSYAATYLKEEIQAEALTKNIEGFSRFLTVVAAKNGEFLDYGKLGSQAGIAQKTASRFFEILEDTLIVRRLNAYAKAESRRLTQHPKFYFFDVGVLNGLLGNFTPSADRIGSLFEMLVFNQMTDTLAARGEDARFSTYRTAQGSEIDFVLELGAATYAIEVKASRNVGPSDLRALKAFQETNKKSRLLVVYLGDEALEKDGVRILPLALALKQISAGK